MKRNKNIKLPFRQILLIAFQQERVDGQPQRIL
jgi:hypothetical protein